MLSIAWYAMFELQQLKLYNCSMTDLQLLLTLKQKLDHYRLPSSFAVEDLPLVKKLLERLELAEAGSQSKRKDWRDDTQQNSKEFSEVQQALSMEVARLFRENNDLRRELWLSREDNEQLRLAVASKMQIKLQKEAKELDQIKILQEKSRREEHLLRQLQEIRYKYNELMELIHEDPHFEREYIKRLIKFKKLDEKSSKNLSNLHQESHMLHVEKGFSREKLESGSEVGLLKSKLITRQQEILRLQTLLTQNNNYIHYQYRQQKHQRNIFLLSEEINKLQEQITVLKKQMANVPQFYFKSIEKQKKSDSNQKQKLIMKRYKEQFEPSKQQQQSLILQQKYVHKQTSSKKQNKKQKSSQQQQNINKNELKKNKIGIQNEYYHNSQISHQTKNKQKHKSPTPHQNKLNKQKPLNEPPQKQSNQKQQKIQKQYVSNSKNAKSGSTHVFLSPQTHHSKPSKQTINNDSNKPHKIQSNLHTSTSPKREDYIIQKYQKLLSQKDARIAHLQQQLKTSPSRSTKVISTQNINTNNSPSKNVIIKTNKSEYININNINKSKDKKRQTFVDHQLASAAKQRQKLAERVESLQRERQRERQREDSEVRQINSQNYRQAVRDAQQLRRKLIETQNSLYLTNQKNISLQSQVNQLLLSEKMAQNVKKQKQKVPQKNQQQAKKQYQDEINRLKNQINSLNKEKKQLINRVIVLQNKINEEKPFTSRYSSRQNKQLSKIQSIKSQIILEKQKNQIQSKKVATIQRPIVSLDKQTEKIMKQKDFEQDKNVQKLRDAYLIFENELKETQTQLKLANDKNSTMQKQENMIKSHKIEQNSNNLAKRNTSQEISYAQQLKNAYQQSRKQLKQAQNNLLKSFQQKGRIQKDQASPKAEQANKSQESHHCDKQQQLNIKISFLECQIHQLKIQINNLSSDKLTLLARLRQLQGALHHQATEMKTFQHRFSHNHQQSSSAISQVGELHNDSEIHRQRRF